MEINEAMVSLKKELAAFIHVMSGVPGVEEYRRELSELQSLGRKCDELVELTAQQEQMHRSKMKALAQADAVAAVRVIPEALAVPKEQPLKPGEMDLVIQRLLRSVKDLLPQQEEEDHTAGSIASHWHESEDAGNDSIGVSQVDGETESSDFWARLLPFVTVAKAGQSQEYRLLLRNNRSRATTFAARLMTPPGWETSSDFRSVTLEPGERGEIILNARAPGEADSVRRSITAELHMDGRRRSTVGATMVTVLRS